MRDIQAGVYRHYKGQHYLVLGYGHDANHEGRNIVVYVGLELDSAKTGPRLAVRDVDDGDEPWWDFVCTAKIDRDDGDGGYTRVPCGSPLGLQHRGVVAGRQTFQSLRACPRGHSHVYAAQRFTYLGPSWEG